MMILQQIICENAAECERIADIQYAVIHQMIYLTLYFAIGYLTVKVINNKSYNIFDKLTMLGVSKQLIYIAKAFLYCTWPILWVAILYGFIRSKINTIRND